MNVDTVSVILPSTLGTKLEPCPQGALRTVAQTLHVQCAITALSSPPLAFATKSQYSILTSITSYFQFLCRLKLNPYKL